MWKHTHTHSPHPSQAGIPGRTTSLPPTPTGPLRNGFAGPCPRAAVFTAQLVHGAKVFSQEHLVEDQREALSEGGIRAKQGLFSIIWDFNENISLPPCPLSHSSSPLYILFLGPQFYLQVTLWELPLARKLPSPFFLLH